MDGNIISPIFPKAQWFFFRVLTLEQRKEYVTLTNESFVQSPDEPSTVLTERRNTELRCGELVPIKFLERKYRIILNYTK